MKKIIQNKYFLFSARILIGFLFIFASAEKIYDPNSFAEAISNYRLFPVGIANFAAVLIPWIELVTGILLIFGIYVRENITIILLLLLIFTLLVFVSLLRGLDISCGCFGTARSEQIGIQKIIENIALVLFGISLLLNGSDFLTFAGNEKHQNR